MIEINVSFNKKKMCNFEIWKKQYNIVMKYSLIIVKKLGFVILIFKMYLEVNILYFFFIL